MELFAIKIDGKNLYNIIENESMSIIGYLEQGEKGFYIHIKDKELLWEIIKDHSLQKSTLLLRTEEI